MTKKTPPTREIYDTKAVLWQSVGRLMEKHYGAENLNRLARDAGVGPATSSRLKKQETGVRLDTLDRLSEAFDVPQWQLLVPGFDPLNPPNLVGRSALAMDLAEQFDKAPPEVRQRAYAMMTNFLSFGAELLRLPPEPEPAPAPAPTPVRVRGR
jgi:hypothetical protein